MAACTFTRLCSIDTTEADGKYAGELHYDSSSGTIFCVWLEQASSGQTGSMRFARYNPVTRVPSLETAIRSWTYNNTVAAPAFSVLGSTLVAAWYTGTSDSGGNEARSSESTDGGVTWAATADINSAVGTRNEYLLALAHDGTTFWAATVGVGSPGGTGDVRIYSRTGASTWTASAGNPVYNSGGGGGTPGPWETSIQSESSTGLFMSSATAGCLVGFRSTDAASNTRKLTCLYTADGWATATPVDIDTATGSHTGRVKGVKFASGRILVMYGDPDNNFKPLFAYSDDSGVTWTLVATPPIVSSEMTTLGITNVDASFDISICLDAQENIIFSFSSENVINPGYHLTFRGTIAAGFVLAGSCSYVSGSPTWNTSTTGRSIIVDGTMQRLLCAVNPTPNPDTYLLDFLAVEGAGVPEEPEEPEEPPPAIESGADDNNMLLRIDMAEGRGWSVHTHAVSCFLTWPEGDKETGREIDIVLTGNPQMDPAIQATDLLAAFYRIETRDEDGYGKRQYFDASSDQQVVRYDPFRTVIKSKKYTITGDFDKNVVRAAMIVYSRHGLNLLPVTVIVDNMVCRVIEMPTTFGIEEVAFFAMPDNQNVGTTVQFVVDVTDNDPWTFDAWGVKYLRKRVRG